MNPFFYHVLSYMSVFILFGIFTNFLVCLLTPCCFYCCFLLLFFSFCCCLFCVFWNVQLMFIAQARQFMNKFHDLTSETDTHLIFLCVFSVKYPIQCILLSYLL